MTYREREGNTAMLARSRAGGRRFITAASGPLRGSQPCSAWTPGVSRDLDLTAAYGIGADCPRKGQRGCRIPVSCH
jgi:hypothetical protein